MRILLFGAPAVMTCALSAFLPAQGPRASALWARGQYPDQIELGMQTAAVATDDLRLVALEGRAGRVRVFDRQGRVLSEFGRIGQGPGEFASPISVGVQGDTIWVSDAMLRRVTKFSFSGRVLETLPIKYPADTGDFPERLVVQAVLKDGTMVGTTPVLASRSPDNLPESRRKIYKFDGRRVDTLLTFRVGHPALRFGDAGVSSYQPFNDGDLVLFNPIGQFVVLLERRAADSFGPRSFVVTRVFADGRRTRAEIPYEPIAIPKAVRDSVVRNGVAFFRNMPSRCCDRMTESDLERGLFLPKFFPPVSELAAAGENVLVRREAMLGPWARWLAVNASGRVMMSFELPAQESILVAKLPFMWTLGPGKDGEPVVKMYRIPE